MRLLKIKALPLSVTARYQTRLKPPFPLDLKYEEARQRLLPFWHVNFFPYPKRRTRPKLLVNGCLPLVGIVHELAKQLNSFVNGHPRTDFFLLQLNSST
jgi:hypothetical protein